MDKFCLAPGFGPDDIAVAFQSLRLRPGASNWLLAISLKPDGASRFVAFAGRPVLELFGCLNLEELCARILFSSEPGAKFFFDLTQRQHEDPYLHFGKSRFFLPPPGANVTFLWRRVPLRKDALFLVVAFIDVPKSSLIEETGAWPSLSDIELLISPAANTQDLDFDGFAARLAQKFPGQTSLRFTWAADGEQRCCLLSPPLEEVVGPLHDKFLGKNFLQALLSSGATVPDIIQQDIAERRTFSDFEFLWPVNGADAAVPVRLGAFPCFDQNNIFSGYRGFGVIYADKAVKSGADRLSANQPDEPLYESTGFSRAQIEPCFGLPEKGGEGAALSRHPPNIIAFYPKRPIKNGEVEEMRAQPVSPEPFVENATATLAPGEEDAFREIAFAGGGSNSIIDPPAGTATSMPEFSNGADKACETDPHETNLSEIALLSQGAADAKNLVSVLELIPFGILVCRDQSLLYANRVLLDFLDFADLQSFRDFQTGRLQINREMVQLTVTLQNAVRQDVSFYARTGPIRWDGQEALMLAIVPGASQQPAAALEAKMHQYERDARELRAILDTATDGVAVINGTGRIIALNRSGEALFGYDQNEVLGKPFSMLVAPESRFRADEYLQGVKDDGVFSLLNDGREIFGLARQGGVIPLFVTLGRISDSRQNECNDGALESEREETKYCALLRDLTHWKKVEQELEDARTQAERASALKSDFLAKVSHEIRTPLNAILGFAEVIIDERFGPLENERYKDYLKDIYSSGALVMSIVNDLLDLSKIEAGKMDLEFVAVDANQIVTDCVSIMQPQANHERVIVRLSLSQNLPLVFADERSLRQIILNLLSNAVKFNEPGGQVIIATTLTDARQIIIRIRDTGAGMSEEDIKTALEPFRQLTTSRPPGGTGLGLPLTKALIEANRAYFSIKSKKDEGTMIEITFPSARIFAE